MKRQLLKLLPLLAIALLTGCSTYQYTSRYMGVDRTPIRTKDQSAEVLVDFTNKVTATSNYCLTKNDAIREAEYMCLIKYDIDVVVDPIFKIEYSPTNTKRKYRATVSGFAGSYVNAPTGIDAVVGYDMEDVEKYKLMTDPTFAKHYYNESVGNTYYVNTRNANAINVKGTESKDVEKAAPLTQKLMDTATSFAKRIKRK